MIFLIFFYQIGSFSDSLNFTIDKDDLINPIQIFPTKCPNPKECLDCSQFLEENSKVIDEAITRYVFIPCPHTLLNLKLKMFL